MTGSDSAADSGNQSNPFVQAMLPHFLCRANKDRFIKDMKDCVERIVERFFADNTPTWGSLSDEDIKRRYSEIAVPDNPLLLPQVLDELEEANELFIRFNDHFIGQMHPWGNMPALLGSFFGTFYNENRVADEVSPSSKYMEFQVARYICNLIGYDPDSSGGYIVSGGTIANLTAMLTARNKMIRDIGKDPTNTDISRLKILTSEDAHYSVPKIAEVITGKYRNCVNVKTTDSRMDISDLKKKLKQYKEQVIAIFATAGTTNLGKIDPLKEIGDIAESEGVYFHVDAAHGGGFLVSDSTAHLFNGISKADSVTIDGHKMFYTNYSCGGIFFKDWEDRNFISQDAIYLQGLSQTLEGSRGTSGIMQIYASLKGIGKKNLSMLVEHTLSMTRYFRKVLQRHPDFEVLAEPELNLLVFRYAPEGIDASRYDSINKGIYDSLYNGSGFYLGSTGFKRNAKEIKCLRAIVMSPYTDEAIIDSCISECEKVGRVLARK